MTVPTRALRDWFGRSVGLLMIVCAVGTCMNFAGLTIALILIGQQAGSGADARERQQLVYPVSLRLYEDAQRRGVISRAELACFKSSMACPKRP